MREYRILSRLVLLLVAATFLVPIGCSGKKVPEPADPEKAREALKTALEAWKGGDSPSALEKATPPIRIADDDWLAGLRLSSYEIQDSGEVVGNSLHATVVLHLVDSADAPMPPKTVLYFVSTNPGLNVIRDDNSE